MPLARQAANFNFSQGVDLKSDPFQLPLGKLTSLVNCVFTVSNLLSKRNGYQELTALPDLTSDFLSTFNNDLIAIGESLFSYSSSAARWTNRGEIVPLHLDVIPVVRSSTNQSQSDSVTASTGVTCTVYTDQNPSNLSAKIYKYTVSDINTGVTVVSPTQLTTADASLGTPRVFMLSGYFIILFTTLVTAVYHLKYIAISISDPTVVTSPADVAVAYTPAATLAFDGTVFNNQLYIAYNGASASGIKMVYLTNALVLSSTFTVDNAHVATQMSVSADTENEYIWTSYYDSGTSKAYALAVNPQLATVLSATEIVGSGTVLNITSLAQNGILNFFYEISNAYSFDSNFKTNYISSLTVTIAGVVSSPVILIRSVGLASKAYAIDEVIYFLCAYQSTYQSTYFLCDSSGSVVAKLAYQNGGGYLTTGLPGVTVQDTVAIIPYLFRFAISSVNKTSGIGVYAQLGVNLASFDVDTSFISVAEIGNNLHVSGGFLWAYDGNIPVEQNFHLWPDLDTTLSSGTSVAITTSAIGGSITTQDYTYIATYEWQDNKGNLFRSGISLRAPLASASLSGSSNSVTVNVPTLRLTYKIANPPKIVLYRASTAQPTFYQVNPTSTPTLNNPLVDSVAIVDTLADGSIIGNPILYTTGGVLENTGGQAFKAISIFDNRLFGILAENPNTLAYSQPIVDATPVEMSQFLTKYISPTIGAQGNTGENEFFGLMDDKLILFKKSALYYFNGAGPDLTGSNNQYSEPIFITCVVGSTNQNSIIFIPQGLMFQSDNGIWLLGRDLSTKYIGADVDAYNNQLVLSATSVPGTTYVLFSFDSGITLMYDYFYNQWGEFKGVPAISGTILDGRHTYMNAQRLVLQETPGTYLDGSSPILMSLTTGWIPLAGLQGYQRAYRMFLLGTYQSPHKIYTSLSYDYNPAVTQAFTITPINISTTYGSESPYGEGNYGGTSSLEQYQINFMQQKCQSFQLSLQELYDPTLGMTAGAGFTLSGANVIFGYKKGYPRVSAAQTVG